VRSLESRSTDDGGEEEKTSCGKISLPSSFYNCRTVGVGVEFVFVSFVIFRKTNLSRWNICLVTNLLTLRKCPLKE